MIVMLASAGGGGYAASLLFYFLQYIDTVKVNHQQTLLDKLSLMSVVSGSAVTGMDYALRGREMFDDFEEKFLKVNVVRSIFKTQLRGLPFTLPNFFRYVFNRGERTRLLSAFFEDLYSQALYKDRRNDVPEVVVNASSPEVNRSFYFTPEYFSIFGRDLPEFSVGQAVGIATSLIPQAFGASFGNNLNGNQELGRKYLDRYRTDEIRINFPNFWNKVQQLTGLLNEKRSVFLHLRDGGFSDSTGMSYILEQILPGGKVYEQIVQKKQKKLVVFRLRPVGLFADDTNLESPRVPNPGTHLPGQVIGASSGFVVRYVQYLLEFYRVQYGLKVYFIDLHPFLLDDNFQEKLKDTPFNSFGLTEDQLVLVRESVSQMFDNNPVYQQLLLDIHKETDAMN